jgi:acyl-CoA synthetase (AMP-forming)/AMP-acid ligase II
MLDNKIWIDRKCEMMNDRGSLQHLLAAPLQNDANKTAVRVGSLRVSYRELDLQIRSVAAGLRRCGVEPGDRVAWLLPNCLEAVVTTMACYQIGAIAVPLNYRYVVEEARDVLERTRAGVLVYHASRAELVQSLQESGQRLKRFSVGDSETSPSSFDLLRGDHPLVEAAVVEPSHPALILFTSGSTGRPKGVVHSHQAASFAIDVSRRVFDFRSDDVVLVGKPISHAGGLQTQLMPTLLAGGEVVLAAKPAPADAVALIQEHQVTEYGLLASDLLDFVEYLETTPTNLPSLKNAIGSGDSVPEDLHHRFRDLFGWEVMEGAGMTEVGGYYAANPRFGTRKWGSLGIPTPGTEVRVVDPEQGLCATGQTGQLVLRMKSSTIGYWEDPRATESLYRQGWMQTGDLGYQDEDGYIWFVGRKKLMIVRRGSNIAPAEVENVLNASPLVHASVVVGVTHPRDGQVPVACVALLGKLQSDSEQKLRDYVAGHLAAYKNPTHYLFLDSLPRTGTGKFDRNQLREAAQKEFG